MAHPDFPQRLLNLIANTVTTFLLIMLFYILQYIFDMDFVCSCRQGVNLNGALYLAAPPLILTLVANIMKRFHQSSSFFSWRFPVSRCTNCNNNFCSCIMNFFFTYVSVSAIWVSTVLFDGDWYFCLKTNLDSSHTGLPCRKNLTYNEDRIKDAYRTDSLDWGFAVICGFLMLWAIVESCQTVKNTDASINHVVYEELQA
ncbi:hypothetical protein EXN66_Car010201 [Channa argus]|uniref:Uncharacterized protein n=1 Tax=Channa argus TaxID=215402 RepID=A0A6G1PW76_CHAAH|nr:hypothetical protein EXN66_Car010201 [Channa argus]KAK2905723.1 hypothetical protein Q8A73_009666 [Channa argus]